jgi:Reverse transcriptase (RNA-dependent DNA polymerase)
MLEVSRDLAQPVHPTWAAQPQDPQLQNLTSSHRALSTEEMIEYAFLSGAIEPHSYKEAIKSNDSHKWLEAAQVEYKAIMDNNTWDLVPLPQGQKAVGSCWVFKIKENADGSIERYKAQLVAQGFSQKPHLDYTETFAPVAKFASLRAILAIAAIEDMDIDHMDVSSAFLNGDLEEEIYMAQPEGFIPKGKEGLVCHLRKPLYGLKQSPWQWYKKLNELFMELGFKRIQSDHSLFVWAQNKIKIIIPVYVDDLTIACNDQATHLHVKSELQKQFKMRDLGSLCYLIGVQITWDHPNHKRFLSQQKHIHDILECFHQSNACPVSTPLDPNIHLSKDMSPKTPEEVEYMK